MIEIVAEVTSREFGANLIDGAGQKIEPEHRVARRPRRLFFEDRATSLAMSRLPQPENRAGWILDYAQPSEAADRGHFFDHGRT